MFTTGEYANLEISFRTESEDNPRLKLHRTVVFEASAMFKDWLEHNSSTQGSCYFDGSSEASRAVFGHCYGLKPSCIKYLDVGIRGDADLVLEVLVLAQRVTNTPSSKRLNTEFQTL
jgi:hypothetical protein